MLQRTWNITAFGDIRGFGSWSSRAAVSPEIKKLFIFHFYALMDEYVIEYRDVHFKREGDGFMASKEFEYGKERKKIVDFILTLRDLVRKIKTLTRECQVPLDGVRIRFFDGYLHKIPTVDQNDPQRKRNAWEYLDYATNGASHLLKVNPEITCVATSGVVRSMGKYGSVFRVRELVKPSCYPPSLNEVDINELRILQF